MKVRGPILKWLGLSWNERGALFEALFEVSINTIRLKRGVNEFDPDAESERKSSTSESSQVSPVRLAQMVQVVGDAVPWEVHCLNRSISLIRMLRRRGFSPGLRLGVRRREGELQFHAWVESDGLVVNDRPDIANEYEPFSRGLPPRGATLV